MIVGLQYRVDINGLDDAKLVMAGYFKFPVVNSEAVFISYLSKTKDLVINQNKNLNP